MKKYLQTRNTRERAYDTGKKGERTVLRRLGAKPTRRSGAGIHKGDGRLNIGRDTWHIEIKSTDKNSYSLKKKDLMELLRQTMGVRVPVIAIHFNGFPSTSWVAIPMGIFERLTEELGKR